jgi:hypothetical protein
MVVGEDATADQGNDYLVFSRPIAIQCNCGEITLATSVRKFQTT